MKTPLFGLIMFTQMSSISFGCHDVISANSESIEETISEHFQEELVSLGFDKQKFSVKISRVEKTGPYIHFYIQKNIKIEDRGVFRLKRILPHLTTNAFDDEINNEYINNPAKAFELKKSATHCTLKALADKYELIGPHASFDPFEVEIAPLEFLRTQN